MTETQINSSGWGSPGDTIALLLVGIVVVVFGYWFMAQSPAEKTELLARGLNIMTFILMQPGIFLTVKIISSKLPPKKKLVSASVSCLVIAFAIPIAISAWLFPTVQALIH